MEDIGKELYEKIAAEFERTTGSDSVIQGILQRISKGTAQPSDIALYAQRLGARLRKAIESHVSADVLPNGQMYYNIAEKILRPSLSTNYELFNAVAQQIQTAVDQKQGIRIKAQKAEFPEDRIDTVIGAAAEPGIPEETMLRRMSVPAETITQSYADDYAKVNADFRSKAGIDTYIIRRDDGKCCPWCAGKAGKYRYPDEVPKDVYRRHDNCGCTVEYISGGMRQNVHTKRSGSDEQQREWLRQLDERKNQQREKIRQAAANAKKPRVLSKAEGSRIKAEVLAKRRERLTGGGELTGEAKSGILDIAIDDFVPCLKDAKTGEILQTEVRPIARTKLSHFTEANGWGIDWIKRSPRELTLGVFLRGDDEPQGLVSLRKDKGGIYVSFACTAPQNNKLLNDGKQQYIGVGGHLFAAAVEESIKSGYNGCIYGFAANKKLLDHYVNKFGAVHLPIAHEYQFVIDGEAAKRLIETYNFERKQ